MEASNASLRSVFPSSSADASLNGVQTMHSLSYVSKLSAANLNLRVRRWLIVIDVILKKDAINVWGKMAMPILLLFRS